MHTFFFYKNKIERFAIYSFILQKKVLQQQQQHSFNISPPHYILFRYLLIPLPLYFIIFFYFKLK